MAMLDDFYPAAEKILSDIERIIQKDPKLNTVEIIPRTTNANRSPVHHEEHSLGLESWCIQPVYCHAYQCVMNIRQNKQKSRDLTQLNTLLVGVLMINPDITSFWNMRKDLINCGKLDPYFELHFSAVVLSRKPKSSDVYAHRKWVLNKILKGYNDKCELLANEMHVCEIAADRYSNNYHAWTHRLWCFNQGLTLQANRSLFSLQELNWSQSWVLKHVSDYSGLHYRQQVLSELCDHLTVKCPDNSTFPHLNAAFEEFCGAQRLNFNASLALKLLISELLFNAGTIRDFVAHEALWCHRRFILHLIKKQAPPADPTSGGSQSFSNGDGIPSEKNQKLENSCSQLIHKLDSYESLFLKQFTVDSTDPTTKKYVMRHRQWLSRHLNLEDFISV